MGVAVFACGEGLGLGRVGGMIAEILQQVDAAGCRQGPQGDRLGLVAEVAHLADGVAAGGIAGLMKVEGDAAGPAAQQVLAPAIGHRLHVLAAHGHGDAGQCVASEIADAAAEQGGAVAGETHEADEHEGGVET